MVRWDAVPRGHQLGVIWGYKLRVRHVAEGYDDIKHPFDKIVLSDNSRREMLINGLETFSRYTVEVSAFTRRGVGPYSEPIIVGNNMFHHMATCKSGANSQILSTYLVKISPITCRTRKPVSCKRESEEV